MHDTQMLIYYERSKNCELYNSLLRHLCHLNKAQDVISLPNWHPLMPENGIRNVEVEEEVRNAVLEQ